MVESNLPGRPKTIGTTNIEKAKSMLERIGVHVEAIDVGGALYRKIVFQLWNGSVWVRRQKTDLPAV